MTDYLPGWPCAPEATDPPSVDDQLSNPSGDDLLPQVLALTPRGSAWGTDEAGDGSGASPVMRLVWSAIAAWSAASYGADFQLATQALPSAITYSLRDWEAEYGLPDPCVGDPGSDAERLLAVRARYAALGGQSPDYFICLAASLGFTITVDEFAASRIGSRIGDRLSGTAWDYAWQINAAATTVSYSRVNQSRIGDRLRTWGNSQLECALERAKPAQTVLIFSYA